jgi:hypothetical protein
MLRNEIKMNTKDFNLKQVIQDRVNLEDRWAWANRKEEVTLPRYEKPQKVEFTAGVYNFIKGTLNELKP